MAPKRRNFIVLKIILILICLGLIAASAYVVKLCLELPGEAVETMPTESSLQEYEPPTQPEEETDPLWQTQPTETEPTQPPEPITATISSQGDLLMHGGIIKSCYIDGGYNFESNFRYLAPYLEGYDYSVANLETTFGGDGNIYQGWPLFNVPDPFGAAAAEAGLDMLLTVNNHCYDTLEPGMLRTLEVSREMGLDTLGTRLCEEEPRYAIVEVNGIQVGMTAYTYTTSMSGGKPSLNGNTPVQNDHLVNYFSYTGLDIFYSQLEEMLLQMEQAGAEATMVYIHWGTEYEITENSYQNTIAQRICDMGVDVIVGGHPHVVQPIELLTSVNDPEQKTVCIYSLGNAISNQRIHEMRLKTGHTEDGVIFEVTFEKDPVSGVVKLKEVGAVPTWVALDSRNGRLEYNILPLYDGDRDSWKELFNLDDNTFSQCEASYDRTMDIVGPGLEQVNAWLSGAEPAGETAGEATE